MQEQSFVLVNETRVEVTRDEYSSSLLEWLRTKANMLSVRSGCGNKHNCGICSVAVDGQVIHSCSVEMHAILGKRVLTVEGVPELMKHLLSQLLLKRTNVPCGYCTSGLLIKMYMLLKEAKEYSPRSLLEYLGFHACSCIGIKQVIAIVLEAQEYLKSQEQPPALEYGGISTSSVRFGERRIVLGERPFAEDFFSQAIDFHGVLIWSEHSLCTIRSLNIEAVKASKGVDTVITAQDFPIPSILAPDGQEWRLFLGENDTGYCESEVLGIVLAKTREEASKARNKVEVSAQIHEPKTGVTEIIRESLGSAQSPTLHKTLHYGKPIESLLEEGICTVNTVFYSQPSPYIPLEKPCAVAMCTDGHIHIYTQVADILWVRRTLSNIIGLEEEYIHCIRAESSILFNAREDYLLAVYAGLSAYMTRSTVRLLLSYDEVEKYRSQPIESIHDYTLLLNEKGKLIGAKINIVVDGGAYTTDIMKVCDTIIKHATSGYRIENVDLSFMLVSTNTIPRYLPRGKCLEASSIVMNLLLDKLSKLTRFNRFELRANNILQSGEYSLVGEYLYGDIGTNKLLQRAQELYNSQPSVSLSFSAMDTGLTTTNAMCMVAIDIIHGGDIVVYQPYPEYGNGLTTLIVQTILGVVGKENYNGITIRSTTDCMEAMQTIPDSDTAMMYLTYHAILEATEKLKADVIATDHLTKLWGKRYIGFSSISSEDVYSVSKEKKRQGSYTTMMHIARCEEPYIFHGLVVLIDAGKPFNPVFANTLMEGGISLSFNAMVGSKDVGNQVVQTQVEFIHEQESISGYSFKGIYDISVTGLASSYYSSLWSNYKKNLSHYPLS